MAMTRSGVSQSVGWSIAASRVGGRASRGESGSVEMARPLAVRWIGTEGGREMEMGMEMSPSK